MCLDHRTMKSTKRQAGFSMPVVVFIVVIMALLATAIVELVSRSAFSATQEELSNRAFYAAESGASWAMSRLFYVPAPGAQAGQGSANTACAALTGTNLSFTSAAGLVSCSASVTCSANASGTTGFYTISSVGSCGTAPVNAVRQVEVGARIDGP